jgi:hypothetical protein
MTRTAHPLGAEPVAMHKAALSTVDLPGWPLRTAPQTGRLHVLGRQLKLGDAVFIQVRLLPFRKVAETTLSWTNHVGIVIGFSEGEPVIAEGRVPLSGTTSWARFVRRSDNGRVAMARLKTPLSAEQRALLPIAARKRYRVLYDTGFNLHSRRQFCSRFVREVIDEATGIKLGKVERFCDLLARNPEADRKFWRLWYLGAIPWQRETVTPASLLRDERLHVYFDGHVE